jgi:hypothetical protein
MESTKSADFRALTIIALALMTGLTLFAAVVTYLITSGSIVEPEAIISPQLDILLVAGFGLMCLTMSRFLSSKILQDTPREQRQDYPTAIGRYRAALIVRLALLEGPGLLACVFALVTGNLNLLLITIFLLAMMWLARPSETEFAEWQQK